jgi:hypothetical protein
VKDLRTPYGVVSYSLVPAGRQLVLQVSGESRVPPGGFVLVWPGTGPPPSATWINGRPAQWDGRELSVRELPARVVMMR